MARSGCLAERPLELIDPWATGEPAIAQGGSHRRDVIALDCLSAVGQKGRALMRGCAQ